VLDDLIKRVLRQPELLIVDGGAGLESAIAAVCCFALPLMPSLTLMTDFPIRPIAVLTGWMSARGLANA
jgi:hypothetical protein